jgi:hypothetical protein
MQTIGLAAVYVKKFDNGHFISAKLYNKTKPQKLICGFVYLLYPVLAVSAEVQLGNILNILT